MLEMNFTSLFAMGMQMFNGQMWSFFDTGPLYGLIEEKKDDLEMFGSVLGTIFLICFVLFSIVYLMRAFFQSFFAFVRFAVMWMMMLFIYNFVVDVFPVLLNIYLKKNDEIEGSDEGGENMFSVLAGAWFVGKYASKWFS